MKQNAKKIQVRAETSQSRFSPFGGMALFSEAINVLHLDSHLDKAIGIGNTKARQAMSDHEIVESVAAMQILGGDSADGIETDQRRQSASSALRKRNGQTF